MGRFHKLVIATLTLGLAGGLGFVYSGVYPIGADDPHWKPVEAAITVFRDRAVSTHAQGIAVPSNLEDPEVIAMGAEHYNAMCVGCHLSPVQTDSEIRPGLYPKPPELSKHEIHDAAEAFWVIKHGIKLTAMPAWGPTHDDEEIWAMVAFLRKLPKLDAAAYRQLTGPGGDHVHGGPDKQIHDTHDTKAGHAHSH